MNAHALVVAPLSGLVLGGFRPLCRRITSASGWPDQIRPSPDGMQHSHTMQEPVRESFGHGERDALPCSIDHANLSATL